MRPRGSDPEKAAESALREEPSEAQSSICGEVHPSAHIHPSALVESGASIGPDCRIWHHVHVMPGAVIGARSSLGQGAFVASGVRLGSDCKVQNHVSLYEGLIAGDGVFFGPAACFTNVSRPRARTPRRDAYETTRIGDDVSIGANATIRCGISLGEGAFVAAGAVVTKDVPPFTLVVGVPARERGILCRCGETPAPVAQPSGRAAEWRCSSCERRYRPRSGGGFAPIS